ncbi:MAG: AMP-binding protein [Desulfurococcaceae archaeon]
MWFREVLKELYTSERVVPPVMKWKAVTPSEYWRVYEESVKNPVEFWSREARELKWSKPWQAAAEGAPPKTRWFVGGRLSAYYNVVEKHRETWVWGKPAVIWEGEEGDARVVTYSELDELAERAAAGLKAFGLSPGDWVIVYSPPLVESIAVMLAATRLGAPFEPVFTGFGYYELAKRIRNRSPRAVFVADGFYRRGRLVDTLGTARRALEAAGYRGPVVVFERVGPPSLREGEVAFSDYLRLSRERVESYAAESSHPLFGLHSGYEEDFKPITHGTGGFLVQVYSTSRWIGLRPHDTYFCTVWPGWITGVSYVVFGPLMVGSTVVLYDGGPDYPSWDRWWSIVEDYAVTLFLTTSAALRVLSKQGDHHVLKHNMDTLRAILVTAEPLEADTWRWAYRVVGTGKTPFIESVPEALSGRIPVVNLYIQSEIGTFATGNLVNYTFPPIAPGSAGIPIPGFHVEVVDEQGQRLVEEVGELVIKSPWPSMPIEYPEEYAAKWRRGYYRTGDYAFAARDGYVYVLGRKDAVAKVSGYRLSLGAVEKALKELGGLEEVFVARCRDPERLEGLVVVYRGSVDPDTVKRRVRELVGPIAEPRLVVKTDSVIRSLELKQPDRFIGSCKDGEDLTYFLEASPQTPRHSAAGMKPSAR